MPSLLSLDGGGIRGILQTYILEELESAISDLVSANDMDKKGSPVYLADYFDCISGTSVGSIIALYLANRKGTAQDARKEIQDHAKMIFSSPWYNWGLLTPRYGSTGIEAALNAIFKDDKLSDLKTSVVVPAFEVDDGGLFLFWANCSPKRPPPNGASAASTSASGNEADTSKPCTGYSTVFRKPLFYKEPGAESQESQKNHGQGFAEAQSRGYDSPWSFTKESGRAKMVNATINEQQQTAGATTGSDRPQGRRLYCPRQDLGAGHNWFYEPLLRSYADTDFHLKTVARASSAAPTYFPAASVEAVESGQAQSAAGSPEQFGKRTMIDGGMVANNPTLHALSWMVENLDGIQPQSVSVLSLGTGYAVVNAADSASGGGMWAWKSKAVAVLMGSAGEALDAVLDKMYYGVFGAEPGRYFRVQQVVSMYDEDLEQHGKRGAASVKEMLDALSSLDRVDKIDVLEKMGGRLRLAYRNSLRKFAEEYLLPRRTAAATMAAAQAAGGEGPQDDRGARPRVP